MSKKTVPDGVEAATNFQREARQALATGKLPEGIALLEKALRADPSSGTLHLDLGNALRQSGKPDKARTCYAEAVRLAPQNPFVLNCCGSFLVEHGRYDDAEPLLRRAFSLKPDYFEIPANLGLVLLKRGSIAEAEKLFVHAIRLNPRRAESHVNYGRLLTAAGRHDFAEKAFRHALSLDSRHAAAWSGLGHVYSLLGRDPEAVDCLNRALSLFPYDESTWVRLIGLLESMNRLDAASAAVVQGKKYFPACPGIIAHEAKLLDRKGDWRAALELMQKCYDGVTADTQFRHPFFAGFFTELGKLHDRAENMDKAFFFFSKAHAVRALDPRTLSVDKSLIARQIAEIQKNFTADIAKTPGVSPVPGRRSPVFLVGFPRSGTTLLDQILSSHPSIRVAEEKESVDLVAHDLLGRQLNEAAAKSAGPGYTACLLPFESADIERLRGIFFAAHGAPADRSVFVDKLPLNILHIGLIKRVFPDAKIILALRHPCDAVLSCFMQRFEMNPAMVRFLDLRDSARFYDEVFGLWDHFTKVLDLPVHPVRYEDVVVDFRQTVAGLLDFLELPWNEAVLEFDKTAQQKTRIGTPSYHQVTQKIYTHAMGRWQRYRKHLEPVLHILEPHARRFGYSMDPADGQE